MHVSAVSQSQSYLPIGIVHRRPTTAPVKAVCQERPGASAQADAAREDPGPKLLVDLRLIAPRSTEPAAETVASATSPTEQTGECKTCARRRYQDRSDDPSVSFQTPTHLSPAEAEVMVRVHEQEHVRHETAKAKREGKEVDTRVTVHYSVCPECGHAYCSGGTTRVVTRESVEPASSSPSAGSAPRSGASEAGGLDLVA